MQHLAFERGNFLFTTKENKQNRIELSLFMYYLEFKNRDLVGIKPQRDIFRSHRFSLHTEILCHGYLVIKRKDVNNISTTKNFSHTVR